MVNAAARQALLGPKGGTASDSRLRSPDRQQREVAESRKREDEQALLGRRWREMGRAGSRQTGLAVNRGDVDGSRRATKTFDAPRPARRCVLRYFALAAERETRACAGPLKLAAGP